MMFKLGNKSVTVGVTFNDRLIKGQWLFLLVPIVLLVMLSFWGSGYDIGTAIYSGTAFSLEEMIKVVLLVTMVILWAIGKRWCKL